MRALLEQPARPLITIFFLILAVSYLGLAWTYDSLFLFYKVVHEDGKQSFLDLLFNPAHFLREIPVLILMCIGVVGTFLLVSPTSKADSRPAEQGNHSKLLWALALAIVLVAIAASGISNGFASVWHELSDSGVALKPEKYNQTVERGLWIFLSVYLIKVAYIAIFVTAPWDVSDEIGHLGYIQELATGKGIPVLLETKMDEAMWQSMAGIDGPESSHNWIAQHPPFYFLIMVPSWWIGSLFGDDYEAPLYTARICNGFIMVLALWILFRMVKAFSNNPFAAFCVVAMVGSIPLVTQTAAGVSNDALIILLSLALVWRWMCYYQRSDSRNLLWLGLVIGLCGFSKYTFLPLMAAVSAFTLWHFIQTKGFSIKPLVLFLSLGWFPISFWIVRNLFIFGKALPADLDYISFDSSTNYSIQEFLEVYPIFTRLFRSFWGQFGWYGSGEGLVETTMHLPVFYQFLYALLTIILACASLSCLLRKSSEWSYKPALISFIASTLLTLLFSLLDLFPREAFYVSWNLYLSLFSGLFAVSFGVTQVWLTSRSIQDWRTRIQIEAIVTCVFFLVVIFFKLLDYGNDSGMLRGTHGRYFYGAMGCFLVAWVVPGISRYSRTVSLALPIAILMVTAELWLWIAEVIPFFESR